MTQADVKLDLRGLRCPLPVLRIRKALATLPSGARLLAEITDPAATIDVPHFCQESGHKLVSEVRRDDVLLFELQCK